MKANAELRDLARDLGDARTVGDVRALLEEAAPVLTGTPRPSVGGARQLVEATAKALGRLERDGASGEA